MPYVIKNKIQFLLEAGRILSSTLDYNVTLVSLSKLIVDSIADFCIIDILESEGMKRVVVKCSKKSDQKKANKMYEFPPDPRNKAAIYDAAVAGKPILIKKATPQWLRTVSRIKAERDLVKELDLKSFIFAPLRSRGRIIGVLTIASNKEGFEYSEGDLDLLDTFTVRAGLAVDNSKLYSEAQNALQMRDEFLSIASHELKTPLTNILLSFQSAHRHLKNNPDFNDRSVISALETGIIQSRRLSALMNDLLNASVIASGELSFDKEEVDLVEIIKDTVLGFKFQLEKRGIKISIKSKRKEILGNWDRVRLEEVISNLISNAIKYGNNKPISISITSTKKIAIIKISDRGIGISSEDQKHLFQLFSRTPAARDFKGMGVGLYVSRQIISAHGGKISVKSNGKSGSTFTVELPLI